ncbi:MAG: cytochrome b/b6 domain-containing protein [Gammaproteobacteria bacterium]|nr:cytochrome b/b6 domain-containing protein [Gammaproteobacteria bacterium]
MIDTTQIKVWDPLVRFFHWSLVSAFFIAYVIDDDFLSIHIWSGYLIFGIISIRFLWGFIGTPYARFSNFIYKPATIIGFIKDTFNLRAKRYLGHNPAGGAMIITLMISLFLTVISGVILLGAEELAGPAALWFSQAGGFWSEPLEESHEFFANFTLFLILIHILGVIVESIIHKENLVSSMLSGFKKNKTNLG